MGILDLCVYLRVTVQSWKPERGTGGEGKKELEGGGESAQVIWGEGIMGREV